MAAIDDFKQALEDLKTSVAAEIAAVIAKLAQPNPDDAVLADATAQLTALKATLDTETTALNS